MSNENNNLEVRARFMSLAVLQGIGRKVKACAYPPREAINEVQEFSVFHKMCIARQTKTCSGLSGAVMVDEDYNFYDLREGFNGPLVQGGEWLEEASRILARMPNKQLFVFYDTVIMMDTNEQRAKSRMETFMEKLNNREGDPIAWLCKNGGIKVNVATLLNIDGIESQLMFTHDMVGTFTMVDSFAELLLCIQNSSIPLIEKNMKWLNKLGDMPAHKEKAIAKSIQKHVKGGFVWLDVLHSQPLMEMMQYFGFGHKSEIEECIGKALLETFKDNDTEN